MEIKGKKQGTIEGMRNREQRKDAWFHGLESAKVGTTPNIFDITLETMRSQVSSKLEPVALTGRRRRNSPFNYGHDSVTNTEYVSLHHCKRSVEDVKDLHNHLVRETCADTTGHRSVKKEKSQGGSGLLMKQKDQGPASSRMTQTASSKPERELVVAEEARRMTFRQITVKKKKGQAGKAGKDLISGTSALKEMKAYR